MDIDSYSLKQVWKGKSWQQQTFATHDRNPVVNVLGIIHPLAKTLTMLALAFSQTKVNFIIYISLKVIYLLLFLIFLIALCFCGSMWLSRPLITIWYFTTLASIKLCGNCIWFYHCWGLCYTWDLSLVVCFGSHAYCSLYIFIFVCLFFNCLV